MGYIIERFGDVELPRWGPADDLGAYSSDAVVGLPSGNTFDPFGSGLSPYGAVKITIARKLVATSAQELTDRFNELRAKVRRRAKLYRRLPDASIHWCYARLVSIEVTREAKHRLYLDLAMSFRLLSLPWAGIHHGDEWTLDAGEILDDGLALDESESYTLDTSPKTLTITNNGNAPVTNAIIKVTAATTNITNLLIAVSGVSEIRYAGTIAVGKTLVIDCGAKSVKYDGADDYVNFSLTANHVSEEWLTLEPGGNSITVTRAGGADSTITFEFNEGWE